jgi:hypothetical protein
MVGAMDDGMEASVVKSDPIDELLAALERARSLGDLEALSLGDSQGLLVAGAGAFWLCEELAAHAPYLTEPTQPANDVIPNSLEALERTRVVRIDIDGVELLICGRGTSPEHGLLAAARSARRLLARRLAAPPAPYGTDATLRPGLDLAPRP